MDSLTNKSSKLRKFNNLLSFLVIGLGIYIAIIPALPAIELWWKQRSGVHIPYSGALADASVNGAKDNKPIPKENRLVIPTIAVDEEIKEGSNIGVIDSGDVWHRPNSSDDLNFSNTVIVGHRFTYTSPYGTFYHLDKLKPGDTMAVYWHEKEYVYKVVETKVVEPSDINVESASSEARLTLYTCTPIWSAKQRLVVIAKPIDLNNQETIR
jgi:LPXTG-site transpeptidase (sortase) family protein